MNEKKFDDLVKGKLSDLRAEDSGGDWNMFESKWDAENRNTEISDEVFDEVLKNKILHIQPSLPIDHWQQLKELIKITEERKNMIFIAKVMEIAAILLIVFTFPQLSSFIDRRENKPIQPPQQYAAILKKDNITVPSASQIKDYYKKSDEVLSSRSLTNPRMSGSKTERHTSSDWKTDLLPTFTPVVIHSEMTNLKITLPQLQDETVATGSNTGTFNSEEAFAERVETNGREINTIPALQTTMTDLPQSEMALLMPMEISKIKPKARLALAAFVSGDINLINTPFDKLYSLASYNKEAFNNSYGFHISTQKNNLEVESGLGYAKRQYQPRLVTEAYGQFADHYFEKSLNKISFDIVNVPLNLKYHYINKAGWSTYLMVGMALNLIVNAEYDIHEALKSGRPPAGRYTPDQARLDEKPFITGLFHGDNIKDNYFVSVGFGLGIEKTFANQTSVYIQPSYQRQIFSNDIGIGPNKDKIHTSSLQFGVKTFLN